MKSVVVTGGSRSIGLGIAKALVQAGHQAIIISRHTPTPALTEAMSAHPDSAWRVVKWDLSDVQAIARLARNLRNEFDQIYGLVNNAGIGLSGILSITPDTKIDEAIQINVLSPLLLAKHLVGSMMAAGKGRIVNISSIVATTGYPGLGVYSATKASMIGFTHSLAREVGPLGITVNAVALGFIDTEMTNELNLK